MSDTNLMNDIMQSKKSRDRALFLRTVIIVLLTLIASWAWFTYSTDTIKTTTYANILMTRELDSLKKQQEQLLSKIEQLQLQLDSSSLLAKQTIDIGFSDVKALYAYDSKLSCMLENMLSSKEQRAQFSARATYTNDSYSNLKFNSPTFMSYVLKKCEIAGSNISSRKDLEQAIHASKASDNQQLKTGDIVFYESGYVMLYISNPEAEDTTHRQYVIGMTPLGILGLRPSFAKIESVGRLFN